MKKNLTRLAALLLVFAMIFAFAACKDNDTDTETTTAASGEVVDGTEAPSGDAGDAVESTEAVSGDTTDVSEESTAAETETDASGNVVEPEASTPVVTKKPATTAEVIKYYNDITAKAFNAKVGFSKHRVTGNEKLDSNAVVNAAKDLIYKFMGIGAANAYSETVAKGKWDADKNHHYLRASTLGAGDVTSATCTESGDNYIITIKVKPGTTYATSGSIKNNAPIDKCGICVGDEDKAYYDHKRASVIYDAIDDVYGNAKIDEKYSNAVVKATVNAATGQIVKLVVTFDISVTVDLGIVGKPHATGSTTVTYSNFKY